MKQSLRSSLSRKVPFLQVFVDAPRDPLSLQIDFYLVGEETARDEGRPFLAWLCRLCRRRCERQIRKECAP
jgi:hypothetical protein